MKEVRNAMQNINSRIDHAEEWISELEDRNFEITQNRTKENETEQRKYMWSMGHHQKNDYQSMRILDEARKSLCKDNAWDLTKYGEVTGHSISQS